MFGFERRWALAVLEGYAPPGTSKGLAPRAGEVEYMRALDRMMSASQRLAAFGLRVGIWIAIFSPLFLLGRLRLLSSFAIEDRAPLLDRLLRHRAFLIRELALLLKLGASFALMASPTVRARTGYDSRPGTTPLDHEDVEESGERPIRGRLAVLRVRARDEVG